MNIRTGIYDHLRKRVALRFSRALLGVALALSGHAAARAQQQADQPPPATLLPGIEVLATTYLWFPWTGVDLRPSNTRFSSQSTTIGPGDLYGHLTWVPFMGQAEFRSGPFGVVTDFPLTIDIQLDIEVLSS
jgi:hypothetical protein